jgi:hypothetical protein
MCGRKLFSRVALLGIGVVWFIISITSIVSRGSIRDGGSQSVSLYEMDVLEHIFNNIEDL